MKSHALSRLLPWLAAIAGVLIFHRYTLSTGFDAVQADPGDSRYVAFVLEHWNNVVHGRARIGSPLIFYPVQGTLGYSDALAVMGLAHVVLRALGVGAFTAMNVQLVALSLASFGAAYWFMRRGFRLGTVAATIGASFFTFCWPRFADMVHVQMQFTFVLPLMGLLALECLRDGPALTRFGFLWRELAFVTILALTMATTVYYAEFAMLFLVVMTLPSLLLGSARRHYRSIVSRHWPALLAGAALAVLLAWPIARVYLPIIRQSGGRSWHEVQSFLLDPIDLLWLGRENYVWGWAFQHWGDLADAKWPGKRLGIGLVATIAWLATCVWAVRNLMRRRTADDAGWQERAIVASIVLGTAFIQLATLRFGHLSLWWPIWAGFPGMDGLRAIGRVQLVAALPMALGFAFLIDRATSQAWPRWLFAGLVGIAAVEQTGVVQRYSARDAEALSRRVADAIPRECKAALVLGTEKTVPVPPVVESESQFDAAAYLRGNPDVAAGWNGSAWSHYVAFGRAEHRALDARSRQFQVAMMYFYNYTIPLGAALAGIPVVNGLSGWQPPGWDLFDVFAPNAPEKLALWMAQRHHDVSEVCTVRLDLPLALLPTIDVPRN